MRPRGRRHGRFVAGHAGDQCGLRTPCRSSSATQTCGEFLGLLRRHVPAQLRGRCLEREPGFWATSVEKKRCEKKCTCASATASGPQGDSRVILTWLAGASGGELRQPGGKRQLRQAGDVVHAQFPHHGFAIAAHGLLAQVEQVPRFPCWSCLRPPCAAPAIRAAKADRAPSAAGAIPDRPSGCAISRRSETCGLR